MLYLTPDKILSYKLQNHMMLMILILYLQKVPNSREALVPAGVLETDLSLASLVACQPNVGNYGGNEREEELERKEAPNLPQKRDVASENDRDMAVQTGATKEASYDPEKIREGMAATKAQAAFRGYLVMFSWSK